MPEAEAKTRWYALRRRQKGHVGTGLAIVLTLALLAAVGLWWLAVAAISAWILPWLWGQPS